MGPKEKRVADSGLKAEAKCPGVNGQLAARGRWVTAHRKVRGEEDMDKGGQESKRK